MQLDLGGIAKGYACDRALRALEAQGIRRAMIDGEGDFALGDPPPGRASWRIQIVDHPELVLQLSRCGVATSGDSARFVEIGGRRYSHIVNPQTGLGIENMSLATVVGPDGMTADAWATAVSVLGPERAIAALERQPGLQLWMEWRTPDGARSARTRGLDALLDRTVK
jgi:thiamine biosynthesis lipoprotein